MLKLKSTGQQVFEVGAAPDGYALILRPFGHVSRAGNRGEVIQVRNDTLVKVEQYQEAS
jgi:hypothetical protein